MRIETKGLVSFGENGNENLTTEKIQFGEFCNFAWQFQLKWKALKACMHTFVCVRGYTCAHVSGHRKQLASGQKRLPELFSSSLGYL